MYVPTKEDGRVSRPKALILGFGHFRACEDNPWFTSDEFVEALADSPVPHKQPTSNSMVVHLGGLANSGYTKRERTERVHPRGDPPYRHSVTPKGVEALTRTLIHYTTQVSPPLTLVDLLVIPGSVEAVLAEEVFAQELIKVVTGEIP